MAYLILIAILMKYVFVRIDYFSDFNVARALIEMIPIVFLFGFIQLVPMPRRLRNSIWISIDLLLSAILFASSVYFSYYGDLASHYSFEYLNQVGHIKDSIFDILNPTYFLFFFDLPLIVALFFYNKSFNWKFYHLRFSTLASISLLCAVGFTWQVFTQVNNTDDSNLQKAYSKGIASFLTSEVYLYFAPEKKANAAASTTNELQRLKKLKPSLQPVGFGVAKDKNVIVLQLEAFQSFLIGQSINGQEITPHLNELLSDSIYFSNFYQQIGRGNTSDAEFMSVTGLLPISQAAISKEYGDREIPSLVRLSNELGYTTSTFHADKLTFWSRDQLYPALGWAEHYDLNYFGNEEVIGLGPSDQVLYRKTVDKLIEYKQNGQRFFSEVVSITAHTPFNVPAEIKTLTLPDGYNDNMVGNYIQAQHYADEQVGYFINLLKENDLYKDTLIVVYGDHFGLHPTIISPEEAKLVEKITDKPYSFNDAYKIPLILKVPGMPASVINHVGGQSDIMPTIANLMGISLTNKTIIGQDLLNQSSNLLVQPSYAPLGSFITDNYFFYAGVRQGFEDATVYSVKTSKKIKKTEAMKQEYDRALELKKYNDSYLEGLSLRQ
jgi:phosphoglycerol transferase MdoB-like AlkP superfamily enzyme